MVDESFEEAVGGWLVSEPSKVYLLKGLSEDGHRGGVGMMMGGFLGLSWEA